MIRALNGVKYSLRSCSACTAELILWKDQLTASNLNKHLSNNNTAYAQPFVTADCLINTSLATFASSQPISDTTSPADISTRTPQFPIRWIFLYENMAAMPK